MTQLYTFIIMLLTCGAVFADEANPPYIIAHGMAEKNVKPARAKIDIELFSYRQRSQDAMQDVNNATDKIINILADNNVNEDALEASNFLKETIRDSDDNYNKLATKGFEVKRNIVIQLTDLKNYQDIMLQLVAIDHVAEVDTEFDVSNKQALTHELMLVAGKNARNRAQSMAEALDVELAGVQAVSEKQRFETFNARFSVLPKTSYRRIPPKSFSKMLVPSHITLYQEINVVFRIKP